MYYKETNFQNIVEIMASCDRLGLMYVLQKEIQSVDKWFGFKKDSHVVYKLQVVQYVDEEVEEVGEEQEDSLGGQSESEEQCVELVEE